MNTNTKVSLREALYILAFGLLLTKTALSNTTFLEYIDFRSSGFAVINLLAIVLIGFKIIRYDLKSVKKIVVILLLVICFFLSYYYSSYNNLIMLLVLIIGSFNINVKSIVKCHFCVYLTITVLAFAFSMVGIIEDYTVIRSTTGELRHSFGNTYPTDFAAGILYIELDYAFLKAKKWSVVHTLKLLLINFLVFRFTDANNFIISTSILCIAMLIYGKMSNRNNTHSSKDHIDLLNMLSIISFPLCAVISFVIVSLYRKGNSLLRTLDIALGYRIGFSAKAIDQHGLGLFGTNIAFVGAGWHTDKSQTYYYVDNAYVYTSLLFGLIIMILICLMMSYTAYHLGKDNKKNSLIFLIIAVSSLIEPRMSNYLYDSFLLLFGSCVFKSLKTIYFVEGKADSFAKNKYLRLSRDN